MVKTADFPESDEKGEQRQNQKPQAAFDCEDNAQTDGCAHSQINQNCAKQLHSARSYTPEVFVQAATEIRSNNKNPSSLAHSEAPPAAAEVIGAESEFPRPMRAAAD